MTRPVVILLLAGALAGCGGGSADRALDAELAVELQRTLDRERIRSKAPGAVAAVIIDGEGEWTAASGRADLDSGKRVTPDTLFAIGSVTKSFVAALVLDLAEEGVLSLDDRLSRWLPAYPGASRITLRQLLNHTSGVPGSSDAFWRAVIERPFDRWSPERTLSFVHGSDFEPGRRWSYSNNGYVLLGLVVEKATGSTVADELDRRIVDPLGLDSLRLQGDGPLPGRPARGYGDFDEDGDREASPRGVALVPSPFHATAIWTAGGMVGTAADVARWADALFGGRVLEEASLRELQTITFGRVLYGLGVFKLVAPNGDEMWGHDGVFGGYRAEMWHVPARGVTVVTLWNDTTVEGNPIGNALLQTVLRHQIEADAGASTQS